MDASVVIVLLVVRDYTNEMIHREGGIASDTVLVQRQADDNGLIQLGHVLSLPVKFEEIRDLCIDATGKNRGVPVEWPAEHCLASGSASRVTWADQVAKQTVHVLAGG